jgi:hypothetical protein
MSSKPTPATPAPTSSPSVRSNSRGIPSDAFFFACAGTEAM